MLQFNKRGARDFIFIVIASFLFAVAISWLPLMMGNVIVDTFNLSTELTWQTFTFAVWVIIGAWWTITE